MLTRSEICTSNEFVLCHVDSHLDLHGKRTVEEYDGEHGKGFLVFIPRRDKISTKGVWYFVECWIKE